MLYILNEDLDVIGTASTQELASALAELLCTDAPEHIYFTRTATRKTR